MSDEPRIRRPSRFFALIIGLVLLIVVITFVGLNLNHARQQDVIEQTGRRPAR